MKELHPAAFAFARALASDYSSDSWLHVAGIWERELDNRQRAAIGFAALCRLSPEIASRTLEAAHQFSSPLPALLSATEDARWWASTATVIELKAYVAATFEALSSGEQFQFLEWANGSRERNAS